MLYNLLAPLSEQVFVFNLFRYLTFRSGGAVLTARYEAGLSDFRTIRAAMGTSNFTRGSSGRLERSNPSDQMKVLTPNFIGSSSSRP